MVNCLSIVLCELLLDTFRVNRLLTLNKILCWSECLNSNLLKNIILHKIDEYMIFIKTLAELSYTIQLLTFEFPL